MANNFSTSVRQAINEVNQYAVDKKHIVGSVVIVAKEGEIIYQARKSVVSGKSVDLGDRSFMTT